MADDADIAIVGAGAAGLAAAIFAAEADASRRRRIVLLDGARRVGAKILVAGGGRCNVTHHRVSADDFHGPRNVIRNVLRAFDAQRTSDWFASLGVTLKREPTGKLFPTSNSAHTVLNALLNRLRALDVTLLTDHRVSAIAHSPAGFRLTHTHGELRAARLIMATGGRSLPKTGSDGAGWQLIQRLGHTVTPTYPALVPLVLHEDFFHARLSGLAQEVELKSFAGGKLVDRRKGSLLWTHFGVSGPVVMDASRFWVIGHARGEQPELRCAMLREPFEAVEQWLIAASGASPRRALAGLLAERLPRRVAEHFADELGNPVLGQLPRAARRELVHWLTDLSLPVVRDRGWNHAEVTAGGVPLSEVDHRTMGSRKLPALHLVGEMLDVDGRIGGFNFQWAWATGHLAGCAAERS